MFIADIHTLVDTHSARGASAWPAEAVPGCGAQCVVLLRGLGVGVKIGYFLRHARVSLFMIHGPADEGSGLQGLGTGEVVPVFKDRRLVYHSTLGLRVTKRKRRSTLRV